MHQIINDRQQVIDNKQQGSIRIIDYLNRIPSSMKTHILKSASKVVKNYPENSARFSTMTIIIIHLQLLATFFLGHQIQSDRFSLVNILVQIFRVFTLEIVVQEFPNASIAVYLILLLAAITAVVMTITIRYEYITRYFWYWIPVLSPIMMGMGARSYFQLDIAHNIPGFEIFLLCSTGFFITLWVIRRVIFIETFGQANMSVRRQIYIWMILITVGNNIIAVFAQRFEIITLFSLVMIALVIVIVLFSFSYVYPQLEYVDLVCKFLCLGICLAQAISYYYDDSLLYLLALTVVALYILQKLSFMKSLLSIKYTLLCKKVSDEQTSDSSLIVLVVLLCRKKAVGFKLGFEQYLQTAYIEILYKLGVNSFVEYSELKREYLFEFLENRYDHSKEEDLNIFLAYWFMHYKMFIKAVKYMTYLSEQKDSFFVLLNNSILTERNKTFLKNCRLLNVKEQEPASHSLCRMDPNAVKQIDPQDMFIREAKLQELTKMVSEAFQTEAHLTKRLLVTSLNANQIEDTMKKLWQKKNNIMRFIKQNTEQFKHKEFVIIQYLFWTVSCHKKFMIFEELEKTFLPFLKSDNIEAAKDDFLAVIVSGENDSIGIIVLANKSMREFFNISLQKVRSRSENIDQILPKSISQQHNTFLYSFKQRGTSKFIGKPQDNFMVIKQGEIFRTDAYVKIYQHLDGLMFAGRLKILQSTDKFILYDSQGFIQNFSKEFELKNDKVELLNIYDMIDSSNEESQNQQATLNIREKLESKTKRHASELAKTSLRRRYSDSKLKGVMSIFVNNRRVKAVFDYFVGQKYFQGICIANLQTEIDEGSMQEIQVLKQDQIKEESIKSLTSETCEKNYFEMERRVWEDRTYANQYIAPFIAAIALLFTSITVSLCLSEVSMFERISEFKTLCFLQHYSKGYRASLFEVGSLNYLQHAINMNLIGNNEAQSLGYSDLNEYIHDSLRKLMKKINSDYVQILAHLPSLPIEFSNVFTNPFVPLNVQYNLSYHEVGNYAEYLFKQYIDYTDAQFQVNWESTALVVQFFTNQFIRLINYEVYPKIGQLFQLFVEDKFDKEKIIIYIFISIEVVFALAIFVFYAHVMNQRRRSLELLSHLSDKQLLEDLARIQTGLSVTEQLGRYQVQNFMVNDKYRTLSFQMLSQQYSFRCQEIKQNTYWQQEAQNLKTKKKKTIHFPMRMTRSSINSFLLLVIIGILAYYYNFFFEIIGSISKNIMFYFNYSLNINDVNTAESGLLFSNMQSYVSGNQNITHMGLPLPQAIDHYKDIIFNRTYVDILVKNIPWESARSMLFQSYCKTGESICENVLDSSFTRGANTASITFALQNLVLSDKFSILNITEVKPQLISLLVSYVDYFAPFFDSSLNQSRNIVFYLFDQSYLNLQFISKSIIVPFILLSFLGICINLYIMNKEIKFLNREIFSIYSVDILTKHMQFAYQINKLK